MIFARADFVKKNFMCYEAILDLTTCLQLMVRRLIVITLPFEKTKCVDFYLSGTGLRRPYILRGECKFELLILVFNSRPDVRRRIQEQDPHLCTGPPPSSISISGSAIKRPSEDSPLPLTVTETRYALFGT